MSKTKAQFVEAFLDAFDTLCGLDFDPSELVSFSANGHSVQAHFYQDAFLRAAKSLGVTEFMNHESAPLHIHFEANGIEFIAIFDQLPDLKIVTQMEIDCEQIFEGSGSLAT